MPEKGASITTYFVRASTSAFENYVGALAYVRPIDPRSQLVTMPIEEYRAARR